MAEQGGAGSDGPRSPTQHQKGGHSGGRGRQSQSRGNQRRDLCRQEYFRNKPDRRDRNGDDQSKRLKLDANGSWVTADGPFTKEEIEAEDRRPKRKVAVMIGYSGTGYRGMQIMPDQPTIEGDLFKAMIAAGAISKANASDPKKNSLVRCARTDKGVHAAGNVISLKLIVEDEDIVSKINEHLPGQIRVWGIERTVGSFSCYQACDSRWYEYIIPTYCFLPPHPTSFLGVKLPELAKEAGDVAGYDERQKEVEAWWTASEAEHIKPILDEMDEDIRQEVSNAMYKVNGITSSLEEPWEESEDENDEEKVPGLNGVREARDDKKHDQAPVASDVLAEVVSAQPSRKQPTDANETADTGAADSTADAAVSSASAEQREHRKRVDAAIKRLRQAYITAKASYRLSPERLARIKHALAQFVGTLNHHNFTIRKAPRDPSARRHIKSFSPVSVPSSTTNTGTYLIGDTEWLSIKVHGQSFMMHQIRKMIGMATLVVRCGSDPSIIRSSLQDDVVIAVPKAPSLGLLLERPVFDSYNEQRAAKFSREALSFDKYEKEMNRFKEQEIYKRIYADEERDHGFHSFFSQIDEYKNKAFLYLSSKGFDAVPGSRRQVTKWPIEKGRRNRSMNRELKRKRQSFLHQEDDEKRVRMKDPDDGRAANSETVGNGAPQVDGRAKN